MVVFVQDVQPPFSKVLEEFERILTEPSPLNHKYVVQIKRKTQNSLQFSVGNYEFDLLPAIDFYQTNFAEPEHISQQKAALKQIK